MSARAKERLQSEAISIRIWQQDFLWLIGGLCQLHRILFDSGLLSGRVPGAHTSISLIEAASQLGLKCDLRIENAESIDRWAFPRIAFLRPSADAATETDLRAVLVLRSDADRVLVFRPGESAPAVLPRAEFDAVGSGTVLMSLVPVDEELVAEVMIKNEDVGFVREGQRVKIKLPAYPFQDYGMIDGTVKKISADASEPTRQGEQDDSEDSDTPISPYKALVYLQEQKLGNRGLDSRSRQACKRSPRFARANGR